MATAGPGTRPAAAMAEAANTAIPFTSATTVLDIGTGPGQVPAAILSAYGASLPASSHLIASDFSTGILDQLELRKKSEIEGGNADWSKLEIQNLDVTDLSALADGSVSHAFAAFVLFMVPQSGAALGEIHRILTSENGGGFFAQSSWQTTEWADLMGFVSKVRPEKAVPQLPKTWATVEGVKGELEAAGFRDVDVISVEAYMPYEDPDEVARFLLTQIPLMKRLTSDMTGEELEKTRDLMVEEIKAKHPETPGRLVGTALVGIGRK
ncbi:hypothetical protein Sste5346_006744 [Sporothrix stenoceras]|uniref:Methyltransferase type 11 domain-containing protein n=1 Tax=Sporothrix stenoceras TaxID=5173 RepID=A0ABR3YY51_9PEZI